MAGWLLGTQRWVCRGSVTRTPALHFRKTALVYPTGQWVFRNGICDMCYIEFAPQPTVLETANHCPHAPLSSIWALTPFANCTHHDRYTFTDARSGSCNAGSKGRGPQGTVHTVSHMMLSSSAHTLAYGALTTSACSFIHDALVMTADGVTRMPLPRPLGFADGLGWSALLLVSAVSPRPELEFFFWQWRPPPPPHMASCHPPPPPRRPPRPKCPSWERTEFTIEEIWSGHFWCTIFWVLEPPPPPPTHTRPPSSRGLVPSPAPPRSS